MSIQLVQIVEEFMGLSHGYFLSAPVSLLTVFENVDYWQPPQLLSYTRLELDCHEYLDKTLL